jgi:hypothetical protein
MNQMKTRVTILISDRLSLRIRGLLGIKRSLHKNNGIQFPEGHTIL